MAAMIDFVAGCFGGAAGVLAGHPLDTIKVRLQTQSDGKYRGTWHCFKSIVKNESALGLYKGMSSPLASLALVNAIVFGVHGNVVKLFSDTTSLTAHFAAGCAAGFAQSFIASPTELLKLRMQVQVDAASTLFKSPLECARHVVRQSGYRPLMRGMLITHVRDCPAFGIYFASYEYMARNMSKDGTMEALTSGQLLLAGGGAGMVSWLFNYPTDVIKTRFQTDLSYTSYWDCIRKTYAENGWRSFSVGLGSTLLRAFPSNAATFFVVEWTYRLMLDSKVIEEQHSGSNKKGKKESSILLGGTDHGHQHQLVNMKQSAPYIRMYDLWHRNSFLLPEAGSTFIDPMLHGRRFRPEPTPQGTPIDPMIHGSRFI